MNLSKKGLVVGAVIGILAFIFLYLAGIEKYVFLLLFLPGFVGGVGYSLVDRKSQLSFLVGVITYVLPLGFFVIAGLLENLGIVKTCTGSPTCSDIAGIIFVGWLILGTFNILAAFLSGLIIKSIFGRGKA